MPTGKPNNGKRNSSWYKKGHKSVSYWTGKKRPPLSLETRRKQSEKLKGVKKSKKHKKNISNSKMGDKNSMWKGGKHTASSGHILVLDKNHPFCNGNGKVFEHRLVVEKKLGRYLVKGEAIHHIDNNPANNNLENLFLTTRSGNTKAHHSMNRLVKVLLKEKIIKFNFNTGEYEKT